jgi:hypothetical protein
VTQVERIGRAQPLGAQDQPDAGAAEERHQVVLPVALGLLAAVLPGCAGVRRSTM